MRGGQPVAWFGIWASYYFPGLRYTLILNAMGIGLLIRAWQGDLYVLRNTTRVPKWFLASIGVVLQIPGAFYIAIGIWSASQMGVTLPGVEDPAPVLD